MYRLPNGQIRIEDFVLPFDGKLNPENRWVKLSKLIPWDEIEKKYALLFPSDTGTEAKPLRMALGSLLIKEKCSFSDRETVEQIKENPYLQYFIGLERYEDRKDPFDPSLMVHFRKRLDKETMIAINELICQQDAQAEAKVEAEPEAEVEDKTENTNSKDPQDPGEPPISGGSQDESPETTKKPTHKGKLLLDATCAPADVRYPTDLSLLNESREKTEEMIDTLYHVNLGLKKKPRTYRKKARKQYLAIAKQRKPHTKAIRKAIGKQLGYVGRNIKTIDHLLIIISRYGIKR